MLWGSDRSNDPRAEGGGESPEATPGEASPLRRWAPFIVLGAMLLGALSISMLARMVGEEHIEVDLTPAPAAADAAERERAVRPVRVAVGSMLTPSSNVEAYQSLIDYLGSKLGRPVEMVQRPTYGAVNELLANGEIDAAFVCSGAYVALRRRGGARLLAVPVVGGETTYRSLVVVAAESPIGSFDQLRGKTFAFVDALSNTGYFYPLWRLHQMETSPDEYFDRTTFTNSHERSLEMVTRGIVDGAAIDSLVFRALTRGRPELSSGVRIIERSPPFAIPPVVVSRAIDPRLEARLLALLLELDGTPEGRRALARLEFDRFERGREEDYDGIIEMLEALGPGRVPFL